MGKIQRIGTIDIVLPDKPNLWFLDGAALQEELDLNSYAKDLVANNLKIRILVPYHFKMYGEGSTGPKTYAEFYVGLLETLFEKLRDDLFPHLKAQGNRRKFITVGVDDRPAIEIFEDIVAPAWETYAPFEKYLAERVKLGLIYSDGQIAMADLDEEGFIVCDGVEEDKLTMLSMFMTKYSKGLDAMFMSDFKCHHTLGLNNPKTDHSSPKLK